MSIRIWLKTQASELTNGSAQRQLRSALIQRNVFWSFQPWRHIRNHPGGPRSLPVGSQ